MPNSASVASGSLDALIGQVADEFLQRVQDRAAALGARYGWELAGAWKTAMVDEDECILLWAVPTWQHWAEFENALLPARRKATTAVS